MTLTAHDRIMWSADVDSPDIVIADARQMPGFHIAKLDRLFTETHGLNVVKHVQSVGIDVFDDAKLVEIPSKLESLAKLHVKNKPFMLNCMAHSISNGKMEGDLPDDDKDGLKRFADVCNEAGVLSCAVTVLTSKTEDIVLSEFNDRTAIDQVLFYVEWLIKAGFTDLVCSPMELDALTTAGFLEHIDANCPGIRLKGSSSDDQARIGTPQGTLAAGAVRLVIGRDITKDPVNFYPRIIAELEG